jgi:phage shock protein PspC (stress-responsive transcriptional regulator)
MTESDLPALAASAGEKQCPWCAETIRAEALKCRFCGSVLDRSATRLLTHPWVRPRRGRMLAGVCAGLADQFGISVTLVRLAFVLGTIFTGVLPLVYVAFWLAMSDESDAAARGLDELEETAGRRADPG